MGYIERLKQQIRETAQKAQAVIDRADTENRAFTETENNEIKAHLAEIDSLKGRIAIAEDVNNEFAELSKAGLGLAEGLAMSADAPAAKAAGLSMGQAFTESEAIKAWFKANAPTGEIPKSNRVQSPAVQFGGIKEILATGGGTSGVGNLVQNQNIGLVDTQFGQRQLTVRDLVSTGTTTSDLIEFARVTGFTNNAAPVPEAHGVDPYVVGAGNVEGKKPQSSLVVEPDSAKVVTIAHWIPTTKRALSDAAQLRSLIDTYLRYGLEEELEDQMVAGDGTGENFKGLLNLTGGQAQAYDTNLLVTTRKAKTKVRRFGHSVPTAYLLNPEDNEKIDLTTDANGTYVFGSPAGTQVQTLWGLPRVECEAVPVGTALVGDFRQAMLYDREQAAIQVSDSHGDFFIRNLVAVLAELRAAFVVRNPLAFVEIDLTA